MADVEMEAAGRYSAADADMTARLRPGLEEELRKHNLWALFEEVEMPLVPVLARMEMVGVAVDVSVLREMSITLGREIAVMEEEIHRQAGRRFNIGSPQQLGQVLFEELKLPRTRKTKLLLTGAQALDALRLPPSDHRPNPDLSQAPLKSCVDTLPALINGRTGQPDFNMTGRSGRLSSTANLRTSLRTSSAARCGKFGPVGLTRCCSADYSQVGADHGPITETRD
jgi:DNA polymerase-1